MQTCDFKNAPIIPAHFLWVSGMLLESGCRADAGLPLVYRARQTAGNRTAEMGEKAPGAWGAPGANPVRENAAGMTGGGDRFAETLQMNRKPVSLAAKEFLLHATPSCEAANPPDFSDAIQSAPGKTSPAHGRVADGAGEEISNAKKVRFIPKPQPWTGIRADGEKLVKNAGPPSFCRKFVTFNPTPQKPVPHPSR